MDDAIEERVRKYQELINKKVLLRTGDEFSHYYGSHYRLHQLRKALQEKNYIEADHIAEAMQWQIEKRYDELRAKEGHICE